MIDLLTFAAVTFNLKGFGAMRQSRVVGDVDLLARLYASVVFWQEAGWHQRYVDAIRARLSWTRPDGTPGWNHRFWVGNSAGLSFDRAIWQAMSPAKRILLHGAVRGVCDERWMVFQTLRHRETRKVVGFISFHHAPKRAGLGKPAQRRGNDALRRLIAWCLEHDLPVVAGGDSNQTGKFLGESINGCRIIYRSGDKGHGIDKVLYVAPDRDAWVAGRAFPQSGANSDHDPVRVTAKLARGAKPTPDPFGVTKLLNIAKREVGFREGFANGHWNNQQKYSPAVPGLEWSQGQAWCATFVSWCAMKSGLADLFPRTASTDAGARWFKDRGQWSEYPAIGAQVFYGHRGDMNHTGLVYGFDHQYIYTVEGNTNESGSREGDGVYLKRRARHDDYVQGYGYPAVPGGLESADPAYQRKAA